MKHKILPMLLAACLIGCGSELSQKNPLLVPAPTAIPGAIACPATPNVFEDFTSASIVNFNSYGGGGTITPAISSSVFNGTPGSLFLVATVAGGYGGANFDSNFGLLNVSCKTLLKFDIMSSGALTNYTVRFRESGNPALWTDENWVSPSQNLAASALWTTVAIPLASFTEDVYGGTCAPNCANPGNGNNTKDLGAIQKFEIGFTTNMGSTFIYIDNIRYE